MTLLSLDQITVAYQKQPILKDFELSIEKGQLISLLGPSGCGKTTTLRLIAGFIEANSGRFTFKDQDYTKVPVSKRNFGFVFQNYALFPHLSVFDNIAFGLKLRKQSKQEIEKRVKQVLEVVNLIGFEYRFPKELSGGQRQRVAIARALVIEPDLLLFDEPLSNLDANLRESMRVEIRRIQQELGITTVYVSHDQEECFSISDQVAIMNNGVIEQLHTPAHIYRFPKTQFVAEFIGFKNFIHFSNRSDLGSKLLLTAGSHSFHVTKHEHSEAGMTGAIRPDDLELLLEPAPPEQVNYVPGSIKVCTFLGRSYQCTVETALGTFTVNAEIGQPLEIGRNVTLYFPENKIVVVE
ncbi:MULTISPECIES: ABC transporter ATP-binding protein [Bacillaceae]|uniref:Carnitine transport ATP-binding protein OpuCA n=1 Tax=Alkalicoccobacillus plakortidis TaxID=444060 RepID=A0A9D5DRF5_9BACI|nr:MULTISPECIES: ABC transporter ATP-binding protein [Bacillaceae]KQL59006.1 spermidine/putrescine ABC transporter ATP-binding protein [Alkalicoccobacillus plakortidis]